MRLASLGGALALIWLAPPSSAAQRSGMDSVVYRLSAASEFRVMTGKAGLLGFAGHGHTIRARTFSGRAVYYRERPSASHAEIVVPADSLEVTASSDTAEIRKVTRAMRDEVLHTDRYPDIRFATTMLVPTAAGFQVQGALTLAGETRPVTVEVVLVTTGDSLWARTRFAVKQTDFGIKPYRGGPAGTVRVADRVTFDIVIVGVAEPESSGP